LDATERVFARDETRIPLAPKAFDTLLLLVQHHGHVLSKDELIRSLWPGSFVEENNLTQQISQLRRALGESVDASRYIETVPKLGYRFAADVREIREDDGAVAVSRRTRTRILLREAEEEEEFEADSAPAQVVDIQRVEQARPKPVPRAWLGIAALVLAATAGTAWYLLRHKAADRNAATELVRLTFDSGLSMNPALSPDGTLVAYASDRGGKGKLEIWVQPVGGTEAVRLTQGDTDSYAPAFSPDGRTVAFRSERAGGGSYTISVRGGEARLVAPYGRRPKFSPDGNWIAYWVGRETGDGTGFFMVPGAGKTYVVSATGGTPREIRPEFAATGYPIWTPDGRHILFLGNRLPNEYNEGTVDWWVTDLDTRAVVGTGAAAAFKQMGFASASQAPEAWAEDGRGVLMSATLADTRNIWRVPISSKDWKVTAPPQRLTFGTTIDVQPSAVGGRLVFASLSAKLTLWSLPLDTDRAVPNGAAERLTDDALAPTYPAVSPDGSEVAFGLQRSGNRDIWIKDLRTGNEKQVSLPPGPSYNPNFSPDGDTLAYRMAENGTSVGYVVSLAAGGTQTICEDCSDYGWSSDKKRLVLVTKTPARVSILNVATRRRTPLLEHAKYRLWNPSFSPDDRWVSFNASEPGRSRILVAPVRDHAVPEQEWITIADTGWDDKPRWSPDGNTLYLVSERDGFRCIWAQHLDSQKRPMGEAIAVFHAHQSQRSLSDIGPGDLAISVARDKIVFNTNERRGNLWLMNVGGRR
jgi:Tol biopolymer transport system component/DNA-binding winged helix-turn-helix (wHTH) protein